MFYLNDWIYVGLQDFEKKKRKEVGHHINKQFCETILIKLRTLINLYL